MPIITLPSNASMDQYPDNTQTDFITNLSTPIICEGKFEVALLEITFRQSIKTFIGTMMIKEIGNLSQFVTADLYLHEGEHVENFLSRLNYELNRIIDNLLRNNEFLEKLYKKTSFKNYFGYKDSRVYISDKLPNVVLYFSGLITKIFKFDFDFNFRFNSGTTPEKGDILFFYPSNVPIRTLDEIFVYTNIIKNQYVGDTLAPLLRGVGNRGGNSDTTTVEFINPLYVELNKTEIRNIHIYLRDSKGNKIPFSDLTSKVIVKLDIRPKKYGF